MNSQPANHYTLTQKQRAILNLLYRFRFATSDQLSKTLNITKATINKRLKLMMELKYIERRYKPEYRLLRKHAAYYLLPEGISSLKKASKKYVPKVLRNIRKDDINSEPFANHCLAMFDVYCILRERYGGSMQFFTKTQMAAIPYFPKQLPDAHIQIGIDEPKLFLLDLLHRDQPFFLATRAVIRYIDYANKDVNWPNQYEFPKILLVCDSSSLQKRLLKKMKHRIEDLDNPNLKFFIATLDELKDDKWHNMANPDGTFPLSQI